MPALAPHLVITPTIPAPFSQRAGSSSQPRTVNIRNTGTASCTVYAVLFSGPFTVAGIPVPFIIGVNGAVDVLVTFSPPSAGSWTGILSIGSDDPTSPTTRTFTGTAFTGTSLIQTREAEFINATLSRYDVISSIDPLTLGELRNPNVFVMKVADRINAKADVFQRVARIADLTTLPQGRAAGLAANPVGVNFEYLTPLVFLAYQDLATAKAGAQAIQDRVGALITQWVDYNTAFAASSVAILLPAAALSLQNALIQSYSLAKKARRAAQTDRDNKLLAKTNAETALTTATSGYNAVTAFSTFKAAGDAALPYVSATGTAPTPYDIFQAALAVAAAAILVVGSTFNISTATTAVNLATTAYTTALRVYLDAVAAETAALNALLAVLPDFDPTTVSEY